MSFLVLRVYYWSTVDGVELKKKLFLDTIQISTTNYNKISQNRNINQSREISKGEKARQMFNDFIEGYSLNISHVGHGDCPLVSASGTLQGGWSSFIDAGVGQFCQSSPETISPSGNYTAATSDYQRQMDKRLLLLVFQTIHTIQSKAHAERSLRAKKRRLGGRTRRYKQEFNTIQPMFVWSIILYSKCTTT